MSTPDQTQVAGADRCPSCGVAMASDQRYCLNCGARRGAPRVGIDATHAFVDPPPEVVPQRPSDVSPLAAVIGIALLGGMLLIGVLIGRSGSNDSTTPAPIVQVDGQTTTPTTTPTTTDPVTPTTPSGAVTTDWPPDKQGFTIQLSLVPKEGATQETVDAAKDAATSSGATDVGTLDSDLYPTATPGNYVIYSGIYDSRKEATNALEKVGASFPDATVLEVAPTGTAPPGEVPQADTGTGGSASGDPK
jgi:hypothetical protein